MLRGGFALVLAGLVVHTELATAEPNAADLAQAKDLYASGERALAAGDSAAALADFQAAYDLSADPALLYKLGTAADKLGDCARAVTFYRRYLAEGTPEPKFVTLTAERIAACAPAPAPPPPAPISAPVATPTPRLVRHGNNAAWIVAGSTVALVTAGIVLAFAASSSEDDIRDLYAPLGTSPAVYNTATAERYHTLIDQGHNYEHLSWAAFGVAAATAAGAVLLFEYGRHTIEIVPAATPTQAGAAATVRF